MLKVAIVGCGKIADAHASQIQRVKGCEIVGVSDHEPLMARQFYERFPVRRCYADLGELLDGARPDVVHVTTPPQSHYDIARSCLAFGAHVYVEKPFTLYAREARSLIALANEKGLQLTVGHDDQFTHVARRMRTLVNDGYLGGAPVHMESYYCYDLTQPGYARALIGDKQHWVRRLPGRLLHNIISHGIARIAEFIDSDAPRVVAHGFVSPMLKRIGERDIIDELRVIITDQERASAYFTFSSQMRPSLHQFRIFGPKNGLVLDHDQESLLRLRGERHKSYAEKFLPQVDFARQHLENLVTNVRAFAARDFHMKSGMKHLIESFYDSITKGTAPPLSPREILLTSEIMDAIFEQLARGDASDDADSHGCRPDHIGLPALEGVVR
jgi:predicted dehydrogenase